MKPRPALSVQRAPVCGKITRIQLNKKIFHFVQDDAKNRLLRAILRLKAEESIIRSFASLRMTRDGNSEKETDNDPGSQNQHA